MKATLLKALAAGAKCLRDKGANALAERLEHNYHRETGRVEISCATLGANSRAKTFWTPGGRFQFLIPTSVQVHDSYWCGLTGNPREADQRLSTLFHELLHFNGPNEDDNNERNTAERHELERTYACESLCFGFPPPTRCSCAVCLETKSCDAKCKALGSCATTEDVQSDPDNCGSCGNKCTACQNCAAGTCGPTPGPTVCGTSCCNGPCAPGGNGCCPPQRVCDSECCTPEQTCKTRLDGSKFCCQSGWQCPCPVGPNAGRVFTSETECRAICPSGLGCFGFSTCISVTCPP